MRPFERFLSSILLSSCAAGCTTVQATHRGAVAYNWAFADARNEILLLNILRAKHQEPLQFSTISSVSGAMRPNLTVGAAVDNFLAGATKEFKPTGELGMRNPSVTLTPLDTKEFTQGMLKPIGPKEIDALLGQGWDRSALLHLAIAGVQCSENGAVVLNDGWAPATTNLFEAVAQNSQWDVVSTPGGEGITADFWPDHAAKTLKDGAGDDYKVTIAEPATRGAKVRLSLKPSGGSAISGLRLANLCGSATPSTAKVRSAESVREKGPSVIFRSPAAMINYVGTLSRTHPHSPFFQLRMKSGAAAVPRDAPVRARYRDFLYYIDPAAACSSGECQRNLTLQTFGLLAQLIAMQTTQATLDASKPVLTVPQ